ncbi:MAG TPA: type IV toxin-antitoxin system AbiEi family antitoxin domain-containing protein [Solirubrobacterales bacterium]|nr:type IV toxin-antitoxin system AbiEi family antitoxin domain-containing protein [Solirubrobacterales bacterium]
MADSAWTLAAKQHGVVARRQLLELGLSAQSIQHRLANGRLHRVHRGVYAVGRPALDQKGHWMAAVLACGRGAALSFESAAALWGIGPLPVTVEVTIPVASPRRCGDIRVHRRPNLLPTHVTVHDAIPVTKPVRTAIDLATRLGSARLERMVNEADRLGLFSPEGLLAALDDYPGLRGVGLLRSALGAQVCRLTDSELERRFLRIVEKTGLPFPQTQQFVSGFRVDFFWPDLGLVVETDGLTYHRTPAQQARDRLRDQAHLAAGLTPLRFTHAQVRYEAGYVAETLISLVSRLGRARAA